MYIERGIQRPQGRFQEEASAPPATHTSCTREQTLVDGKYQTYQPYGALPWGYQQRRLPPHPAAAGRRPACGFG